MRVLWLTFIPSPYRLRFFEELGKSCELTVLFEAKSSKNRGSNWDSYEFNGYNAKVLPGITVGGFDRFCPGVIKYLNKKYDKIVISNPTSPTGIFASLILQIKKIPYIVETDGAFPSETTSGIRHKLKEFVFKPAEICMSTAEQNDLYYMQCNVKKENIRRYPFTSLSDSDFEDTPMPSAQIKIAHRKELGLKEGKIVLSVGRFNYENGYGKGYDTLLKVAQNLPNIGFYIVGDEPTEEFIKLKEELHLDNVHYVGFKKKDELAKYYIAADLFTLLTRGDVWGLVINEAMLYGLPVITTTKCNAGLEMVDTNENGFIVDADDFKDVTEKTLYILDNPEIQKQFSVNSRSTASNYTVEKMANCHINIFNSDK